MEYEIKPKNKFSLGVSELWQHKELLYTFAWRDIKVKYKQTYLGMTWAVFQPVVMTLLFTLGFGAVIKSEIPYPVFALSGFILWSVFSTGLSNAGNSMISNANMIKKIYFPRLIIPLSSIFVSLIDFFISFLIFIPVLYYYNMGFNISALVFVPLGVLLTFLSTFGLGTFLAALNVKYRDFRYILPFFIQALLFATPVIYPINTTSNELFRYIMMLNPMSAPIELFRCSFINHAVDTNSMFASVTVSVLLFFIGIYYFRKTEAYFADLA